MCPVCFADLAKKEETSLLLISQQGCGSRGVGVRKGGGAGRAGPVGHPLPPYGGPPNFTNRGEKNVASMHANHHVLLGYLEPPPHR